MEFCARYLSVLLSMRVQLAAAALRLIAVVHGGINAVGTAQGVVGCGRPR